MRSTRVVPARPVVPMGVLCVGLALLSGEVWSQDWPQFRGAGFDGRASAPSIEGAPHVRFQSLWRRPLGSGYSSVSIRGDRGYTMAAIDGHDYVVGFDLATGTDHFRHSLGEMHVGAGGSDDGPLSTPAVGDDTVYALGARGDLVAVDLTTGERRWLRSLPDDFGAPLPHYGFSTSPVLVGDLLIVETGGPDGAISALNKETGAVVWRSGEGGVDSQIPIAATLHGQRQVLAATTQKIYSLDVETGSIRWSLEQEGDYLFAQLTLAGEDGLLVTHGDGAVYYQLPEGDGVPVKLWTEREFRSGGWNPRTPVYKDGYFYAHTGNFLTCIEAATGKRVWRSRPPGGQALIAVGDHMMLVGRGGEVVAVALDPDGYRETGRVEALEQHRVVTPPTYSGGRLFVRDLTHMAAIEVARGVDVGARASSSTSGAPEGRFTKFIAELAAADDKISVTDRFIANARPFPIMEEGWAHFVYRGDVEGLAIRGDVTGFRPQVEMTRVAGTDLHYASFPIGDAARVQYAYKIFDESLTDPLNSQTIETPRGTFSVWTREGWSEPGFLSREPSGVRGRIETTEFPTGVRDTVVRLRVYVPPGMPEGEGARLLFVASGKRALEIGQWARGLDNLYADHAVPRAVVAFADSPEFLEWDGGRGLFRKLLTETLLPHLESQHGVSRTAADRAVVAHGSGARNVFLVSTTAPGLFGKIALQSPIMDRNYRNRAWPTALASPQDFELRVTFGELDARHPNSDADVARDAAALVDAALGAGKKASLVRARGGYGWGHWREQLPGILNGLFGPEPASSP